MSDMQNYSLTENTKKNALTFGSITDWSVCFLMWSTLLQLGKFSFIFLQGYSCWYALFGVKEFGSQVKKLLWTKKTVLNICKYDRVKKTFHGCFSFDQMVQFVFRKFQVANQTAFTRIFFNFRDLAARNVLIHEDGTAKVCHVL